MMHQLVIRSVRLEDKPLLRNLVNLYLYDMTEFNHEEVGRYGLFEYKYLDHYWTEPNRHAFFIEANSHLAGFVLVNRHSILLQDANTIAEFFVMRKYRRQGVGAAAAKQVFNKFPGQWEVRELLSNGAAHTFWQHTISLYTGGQYQEEFLNDERWSGPVQTFRNG